jgi:phosphatidylinositol kinase/protein kinase (PI-3  family)
MNAIWSRDAECARRALAVRTFSVIPLSPFTGLMEWVDATAPIKAVIEEGHQRYMKKQQPTGLMHLNGTKDRERW